MKRFFLFVIAFAFLLSACVITVKETSPTKANPTKTETTPTLQSIAQLATNTPEPTLMPALSFVYTHISPIDGMKMLLVPAGVFLMGSLEGSGEANEYPQHKVYLDAFWIDKTEVTNEMYKKCVTAGVCTLSKVSDSYGIYNFNDTAYADYPVRFLDWNQANVYCLWAGRMLPTEAQWEKAARGTDGRTYPWGNKAKQGIYEFGTYISQVLIDGGTNKVGNFPHTASPYGAQDLATNVSEWVADWFAENYYSLSPVDNPTGPSSGTSKVLRGGSFSFLVTTEVLRASRREGYKPSMASSRTGFRCALPLQ
jgi:formylglycine-generating enzyme required for sulfatase activity